MMPSRARRQAGFTLVELMIVVTLIAITGSLAARLYSRGVGGEAAPSFARTLMSTVLDARHSALTLGRATRLSLNGTSPQMSVSTDLWDPVTGLWVTQSTVRVPASLRFCTPDPSIKLTAQTPTCPLPSSGVDNQVCFWPNGHVKLAGSSGDCASTTPSDYTGATLYVGSRNGDHKYKVVVWGLTGMSKLIDQW